MSDPIIAFYRGDADAGGPDRKIDQIWQWSDARLEAVHDYIQWLFPLAEPSAFNPFAPVLETATVAEFHSSEFLRRQLKRSLERMLAFYGLELSPDPESKIRRRADFLAKNTDWVRPGNHNHLRLTRILTSTRLLGLAAESKALFECLAEIQRDWPEAISATTLRFWKDAGG